MDVIVLIGTDLSMHKATKRHTNKTLTSALTAATASSHSSLSPLHPLLKIPSIEPGPHPTFCSVFFFFLEKQLHMKI